MTGALIFDTHQPGTTGAYFERACRQMGLTVDSWTLSEASRLKGGYDWYLRIDHGDDYEYRLPRQLRPAAFYAIDTHLPCSWSKIRRTEAWYDAVFCAQQDAARYFGNARYLPLACDRQWLGLAEEHPVWDIAFVGNDGGSPRKFYLQALRERFPKSFIGGADPHDLPAVYRKALIGFNFSIANDVNMRIFEILACRRLLVTNAIANVNWQLFGLLDRQHLVLYRTPQELFELLDYYLIHEKERCRIAQAGWDQVRQKHTYVHRMEQLLSVLAPGWRAQDKTTDKVEVECKSL